MVGRAAEHSVGQISDFLVPNHAALKIAACLGSKKVDRMAPAVLLVRHRLAVRRIRLHVVQRGNSSCRSAERGMPGYIVDPLAADIHDPPVAQGFKCSFPGAQHGGRPSRVTTRQSCYGNDITDNGPMVSWLRRPSAGGRQIEHGSAGPPRARLGLPALIHAFRGRHHRFGAAIATVRSRTGR